MVVPTVLFVAKTTVVTSPGHLSWSEGWITCPDGLTVIIQVMGKPTQLVPPLVNVGVTVMVATTGEVVVLRAAKGPILPLPATERPMLVVVFVHK